MPKRKKNGQSPNRVSAQPGDYRSASDGRIHTANGATRVDPRDQGNLGSMLSNSSQSSFQGKDEIVKSMQEMFSHLDPVVIYIVLSEADFKVENAMDALLELSDAAKGKITPPPPLSGFEMAAALLDPHTPKTEPVMVASESSSASEALCLTEEFDSLIDQELESLTLLQSQPSDHPSPSSIPLSSLPLPSQSVCPSSLPAQNTLTGHQTLPAFEHLDMENLKGAHGGTSPINELSFKGVSLPQDRDVSVDFSHLTEDSFSDAPRPSAFKAYRRTDQFMHLHNPAMCWNIQAPEFQPRAEEPTFITPVMQASNPWSSFSAAQWLAPKPFSQAPLKPSATVPKSWTLPPQNRLRLEGQVLVLLRGAPGSGKTTLASAMLEQNPGGVVLSTDEYFIQNGVYNYSLDLLGEAHAWNHQRAKEAFEKGHTPIIIDNTNLQSWEMKPYVAMALKHKYRVLFREPDTWWKTKPRELEKRTKHGVTKEKIRRMLEHQDRYVSVQNIMSSQPKETAIHGVDVAQTDPAQEPLLVGLSRPDLVGEPGFVKADGHLSSSLPDVSSVGETCSPSSANMGSETGFHSCKEFKKSCQKDFTEQVGMPQPELLDGAALDWELDACIALSQSCDLNKDINDDPGMLEEKVLEQPMAFSSSIGQRVRRERDRSRFADRVATSEQPLNSELSNCSERQVQLDNDAKEDCIVGSVKLKPERLDFVGDWPSESLEQRAQRDQKSVSQTLKSPVQAQEKSELEKNTSNPYDRLEGQSDCDITNKAEFQKFIDLLQGGDNHLSQETIQDSPTITENSQHLVLGIEAHSVLPDCVLDWKSGKSTHLEIDSTLPQSPAKDLETGQDGFSNKDTQKAFVVVETTTNSGMGSEEKDKSCFSTDTTLNSGGVTDHNAEASQERWRGPSRRPGKSCRLALTFTNQSPTSVCISAASPVSLPQLPIMAPSPKSQITSHTCSSSQTTAQTYSSSQTTAQICSSSQTHPQDFSLLWRINHQRCFEAGCSTRDMVVLQGNPFRFVPEMIQVNNSGQQEVPYRMCHQKGSQVEESDLRELHFKQHSLEILTHHFKNVPMETLEDLYEKCHQDMDWTTNLLLDSGERFYKDDEEDGMDPQVDKDDDLDELTQQLAVSDIKQVSNESLGGQIVLLGRSDDCSLAVSSGAGEQEDSEYNDLCQASEENDKCLEHQPKGPAQEGTAEVLQCLSEPSVVTRLYQPVVGSITLGSDSVVGSRTLGSDSVVGSITLGSDSVVGSRTLGSDSVVGSIMIGSGSVVGSRTLGSGSVVGSRTLGSDSVVGSRTLGSGSVVGSRTLGSDSVVGSRTLGSNSAEAKLESQLAPSEDVTVSQRELFNKCLDRGLAEGVEEIGQEKEEEDKETKEETHTITGSLHVEHAKEDDRKKREKEKSQMRSGSMDIKMLELKLPTELALQLTELFGPVGISPGEVSPEDCSVLMDLNFAKLLHQKWKETIQERHRQAALSYHLLQESSVHWGEPQPSSVDQRDSAAHFLIGTEGYLSLSSQSGVQEGFPFMDHWNVSHPRVSLRDIMIEEQVMQDSLQKSRLRQGDLDKKDGASILKENQLFALFPTIDRHFLRDIFTDHNYSLEQTVQFLHALLDDGPARNIVAPKISPDHIEAHRPPSKEWKWKLKDGELEVAQFQDTEDPEYEDFRTEAMLQKRRQQECFSKASEAYRQGRKDVASFYAQQGHLHGHKMKEANYRAAMQIFERVNATLLPQNVLDLHGLHVDEALQHLQQVLADKISEWQQGLCRPQLSVITGRGNRSQGGVARIRPAVLDYLKSQHYRFSEPKPGLIHIMFR